MVTLFLIVFAVSILILFAAAVIQERFDMTNSRFLVGLAVVAAINCIVGAFGVAIATNFEKTEYEVL